MSFDPARKYTRVLSQQGRVTLEAEENEERVILAEERRHELLDIIGPVPARRTTATRSPRPGLRT